jgi:hypothetical protein
MDMKNSCTNVHNRSSLLRTDSEECRPEGRRRDDLNEDDRMAHNNEQRLGAGDGHIEALGVAPEANVCVRLAAVVLRGWRQALWP